MYYALVEYLLDGVRAIVPVRLIKNFNPTSVKDIDKTIRPTFWQSEDGLIENYYDARVKELAGKLY